MIDSPGVAAWVAQIGFWMLMILGSVVGELRLTGALTFLALWLVGLFGFPHLPYGNALFPPCVALLDVALVLVVFKGDIRLS